MYTHTKFTADTSYTFVIHIHSSREYFLMNNKISFCHSMNINNQSECVSLRFLIKPEELQVIIPASFVTLSGIADLKSNGNIIK
jgi:hypothetical protein